MNVKPSGGMMDALSMELESRHTFRVLSGSSFAVSTVSGSVDIVKVM
jgi:hypothetical protein